MRPGFLAACILASALVASPVSARDTVGANEQVGGGGAPSKPEDTRPTTATPAQPKAPEYKREEEQARQQYLDWHDRVASLKEQWKGRDDKKSRAALRDLDEALLTAKENWEKMRQDQTGANFRTSQEQFHAALDRLQQTWQNDVAEVPSERR